MISRSNMRRCDACSCLHRPVPGDGPEPSDIMFIGERPGQEENKLGRPFIGKSGREFNENYLWLAGLRREDIRVTNSVKCFAEGNRKPTEKEVKECAGHHLPEEIEACAPSLIVLMGGTACSIAGDIDLDIEHGIPRPAAFYGWEGIVVPMYHPAAGLHDTGKMIPLLQDFERLGRVLRGEWQAPEDPYPNPDYRLISTPTELKEYLRLDKPVKRIAMDTERHGSEPFSYQFSIEPGTGRMVLCDGRWADEMARLFNHWLREQEAEVVLHNSGQDLDWLERMGIAVLRSPDTMQEAYHLGDLPQGLKALAYRLFGVRMRTYEDVVMPHSREKVEEWLLTALDHVANTRSRTTYKQLKTKVKEIVKPCPLEQAIKRISRYTLENPEYSPWKKLDEWLADNDRSQEDVEDWVSVESTVGKVPIVGIGHVPLEEAVRYGCQDADMTLRTANRLEERRRELVGEGGELNVAEGDEDR